MESFFLADDLSFRGDLQNMDRDDFRFLSWTDLLVYKKPYLQWGMSTPSFFWYFEISYNTNGRCAAIITSELDTFLPLYCELAEEQLYEYEMAFAGARASRSSALDKVVASSIANVSIDRAGLLLITDNE